MNSTYEFIDNYWKINDPQAGYSSSSLIRLTPNQSTNLFIGYNENGNRCLFLKFENLEINEISNKNQNISLKINKPNNLIYIELNDNYFGEIFNDLIISILNKLKEIDINEQLTTFISLYRKWKELFTAQLENKLLSENELLGIIGELKFLEELIENSRTATEVNLVLDNWCGPNKNATDFITDEVCYEIKTISAQKDYVDISSEHQLTIINIPIYLVVYKATISDTGFSIVDLILKIREKIDIKFGDIEKFLFKLNFFKIDFINMTEYKTFKINLSDPIKYNTSLENFPKISTDGLIEGVYSVKYKIKLNSISEFILLQ
jgi:hypothetical protein